MPSPREYPDRPLVGVGVVVRRRGQVLLVKRAHAPKAGEWSLPGGLQKLGETVFAAAEREVREEAGVGVRVTGIVDVIDLIERDGAGAVRYHFTLIDVVAEWVCGEGCAGDDATAIVWIDASDAGRYGLWAETVRVIGKAMAMP
jgi:ADP-ribose pyrophosphatase YjhB (NUDIX family)